MRIDEIARGLGASTRAGGIYERAGWESSG